MPMMGALDRHELPLKVLVVVGAIVPSIVDGRKGLQAIAREQTTKIILRFEMW